MSARMSPVEYKAMQAKRNPSAKRLASVKIPKAPSIGEVTMAIHLRAHQVAFEEQFKFCPTRRWRSDFRITDKQILIEVEGGTWSGGRHTRGKGFQLDCEKYNWATAAGWSVMRFTTDQVLRGHAIKVIMGLLGENG